MALHAQAPRALPRQYLPDANPISLNAPLRAVLPGLPHAHVSLRATCPFVHICQAHRRMHAPTRMPFCTARPLVCCTTPRLALRTASLLTRVAPYVRAALAQTLTSAESMLSGTARLLVCRAPRARSCTHQVYVRRVRPAIPMNRARHGACQCPNANPLALLAHLRAVGPSLRSCAKRLLAGPRLRADRLFACHIPYRAHVSREIQRKRVPALLCRSPTYALCTPEPPLVRRTSPCALYNPFNTSAAHAQCACVRHDASPRTLLGPFA